MTTPDVPLRIEFRSRSPARPSRCGTRIATATASARGSCRPSRGARRRTVVTHMGPRGQPGRHHRVGPAAPLRLRGARTGPPLAGARTPRVTPLVSEFLVEARSGGTCVVRVVSSALRHGADWEQEFFEEMEQGWMPFFEHLRLYLAQFPASGRPRSRSRPRCPGAVMAVRAAIGRATRRHRARRPHRVGRAVGVVEQIEPVAAAAPRRADRRDVRPGGGPGERRRSTSRRAATCSGAGPTPPRSTSERQDCGDVPATTLTAEVTP